MGETVTPRKGQKSAPSDPPSPIPAPLGPTTKSAPTEAPSVLPFGTGVVSTKGQTNPTLMSDEVAPVAPKAGSKDPNITRSN